MSYVLCLMYLAHYWAVPDEGSGRSMEQYLPRLYPPCVVDRLHDATKCLDVSL